MVRRRLRRRGLKVDLKEDPFSLLINFVDCSLVFALGFMVALLAKPPSAAGKAEAGPVSPEALAGEVRRDRMRPTADTASGEGVRLGTAYRLANGDVVYVPDPAGR
jgi:hypothetical protein